MVSYWKNISRIAATRASSTLGIATFGAAMLRVLAAVALIFGLYFWGSEDASRDELVGRGIAIGFVLLVWPLLFAWQFAKVPATESARLEAELINIQELAPLADRLDELSKEIGGFSRDFESSRPSPNDSLNYVSPSLGSDIKVNMGGRGNMIVGPEDGFQARMMSNSMDERRNHEILHLDKFHEGYGGKALSRLRKAKNKCAISEDAFARFEATMQQNYLGNAGELFRTAQALCEEAATSLREMESQ